MSNIKEYREMSTDDLMRYSGDEIYYISSGAWFCGLITLIAEVLVFRLLVGAGIGGHGAGIFMVILPFIVFFSLADGTFLGNIYTFFHKGKYVKTGHYY